MKPEIARRLVDLNREFYDGFAEEFSSSRSTLQPGILRALRAIQPFGALLDLGCGDGRVGRALCQGRLGAWDGHYVGVDSSGELLRQAPAGERAIRLLEADLTLPDWWRTVGLEPGSFEAAVCLSVLHHIPTAGARLQLLRDLMRLLAGDARCALSVWQFLHRDRFRRRLVPWAEVGIDPGDVDAGDVLLDWRRGGRGLRYVHHFDLEELRELCDDAGLTVTAHYGSDGHTGDLGLYVIARRSPARERTAEMDRPDGPVGRSS